METKIQESRILNNLAYLIARTEDRIKDLREQLSSGRASKYTTDTLDSNYAIYVYLKSLEEQTLQ